jgi:hypothetical protein
LNLEEILFKFICQTNESNFHRGQIRQFSSTVITIRQIPPDGQMQEAATLKKTFEKFVGFDGFTAVTMKNTVF